MYYFDSVIVVLIIVLIISLVLLGVFIVLFVLKCKLVKALKKELSDKDISYNESYQNLKNLENTIKLKNEELENRFQSLQEEGRKLSQDRENLNNAMRLFKQQKEAHDSLSDKSEKDIAIDLYLKFIDLERTFMFFQNNLASVDAKLLGVKDYSNDLEKMRKEINESKNSIISQMSANKDSVNAEMVSVKNAVVENMVLCQ